MLSAIARDLAERRTVEPTLLPADQQGAAWMLTQLADLLPGLEVTHEGSIARVFAPSLGLRATLDTRDGGEHYAVGSPDSEPDDDPAGIIVLGTFSPTE